MIWRVSGAGIEKAQRSKPLRLNFLRDFNPFGSSGTSNACMDDAKTYYHRNLPHWQPLGAAIFLTCRLYGSLPEKVIQHLKEARRLLERELEKANGSAEKVAELKLNQHKKLFAKLDAILDKADTGPRWLAETELAALVEDALLRRYAELYRLWAYVVMVNHLHLLLRPKLIVGGNKSPINSFVPLSTITKSIKGYTAREANRILKRTGQQFWQQESFDHWPRDEQEFFRIIGYIENNAVKAGLVKCPEEWRWSSAAERKRRGWTEIRALT
jgi:putative transposase